MKTNLVLVDQGKKPDPKDARGIATWQLQQTPRVLEGLRNNVVKNTAWWMQVLGITTLRNKQTLLGIRSVSDVTFKSMIQQPPVELLLCRNTVVRMLADTLALVGVLEIEIAPDENEIAELLVYWTRLQAPVPAPVKSEVVLNTEVDPTGTEVTNGSGTAKNPDAPAAVPAVEGV